MNGEGFAFFRWHCIKYPGKGCPGYSPHGAGCDAQWDSSIFR